MTYVILLSKLLNNYIIYQKQVEIELLFITCTIKKRLSAIQFKLLLSL